METLSIILLTYNSERTISNVAEQLLRISDDIVAVDSGSSDNTLAILEKKGIKSYFHKYETHALQMNFAIGLAKNDWVLCVDSDELFDNSTVENINRLKLHLKDPLTAYRISRYWYVLGKIVHAIYPVSSPDYPVRLFNRTKVQFFI